MTPRHDMSLDGCRTTPLASYLKALGVLRIVAEQGDPGARGWWQDGAFHLSSTFDETGLARFILEEYQPTPVLAPWNGGSGFYPKDKKGIAAIKTIMSGASPRFATIREAVRSAREILEQKGYEERPTGDEKKRFVTELRARAADPFLRWIDAAIALGTEDLLFPPLLGTGGNDGRLDFTTNYLEGLSVVVDPDTGSPTSSAAPFLASALFARPVPGLTSGAIGQYSPGAAGGPNASTGFSGSSNTNPWDLVLAIEGAILFTSSAVRRLESQAGATLAYPFTVRPTGAGAGSLAYSDASSARAEIWLPVWSRRCTLAELERVFMEGRLVVGRRSARNGLDVTRAVAQLGVDRGIEALERYAFVKRSGNQYLATPLGRLEVRARAHAEVIDDLERRGWLDRFRRMASDSKRAPARLASLGRRLEDALFELARQDDPGPAAREVLVMLGRCQAYLASSPSSRERCHPVPVLRWAWAGLADDQSPEYRIALGLATLHGTNPDLGAATEKPAGGDRGGPAFRTAEYLAPVTFRGRRPDWEQGGSPRVIWRDGDLMTSVARMLERRVLDADAGGLPDLPLESSAPVPLGAIVTWMRRPQWDSRVAALTCGLSLVDPGLRLPAPGSAEALHVPAAFATLLPYFTPQATLGRDVPRECMVEDAEWLPLRPAATRRVLRLLAADRVADALNIARRELKAHGLAVPPLDVTAHQISGPRLLAALGLPLSPADLRFALRAHFGRQPGRSRS